MKKLAIFGAAALGLLAIGQFASAQETIVGVQFPQWYGGFAGSMNNVSGGGGEGYAGGVVQQVYWNVANPWTNPPDNGPGSASQQTGGVSSTLTVSNANLVNSSNASISSTLVDSTDSASAVQFTLSNVGSNDHGGSAGFASDSQWWLAGSVNNGYLSNAGDYSASAAQPVTLSLSGLNPTDSYDLIAYVSSEWWMGAVSTSVNLGSTSYYLTTDASSALTTFTASTSTVSTVSPVADYVEFDGILGSTLNSESLTVAGAETGLGAFQLIDMGPSIPEPATVWSFALGLLGLVAFQSRRNRLARS